MRWEARQGDGKQGIYHFSFTICHWAAARQGQGDLPFFSGTCRTSGRRGVAPCGGSDNTNIDYHGLTPVSTTCRPLRGLRAGGLEVPAASSLFIYHLPLGCRRCIRRPAAGSLSGMVCFLYGFPFPRLGARRSPPQVKGGCGRDSSPGRTCSDPGGGRTSAPGLSQGPMWTVRPHRSFTHTTQMELFRAADGKRTDLGPWHVKGDRPPSTR